MSALGLDLNKETLLGHLFADFPYVFKKKEKGNILEVSVQVTTSVSRISPLSG